MILNVNTEELKKYFVGDLGIADEIYEKYLIPKSEPGVISLDTINRNNGIHATEKIINKSYIDILKNYADMTNTLQKLFGRVELMKAKSTGGLNPNNGDTLLSNNRKNFKKLKNVLNLNGDEEKSKTYPGNIFLGSYKNNKRINSTLKPGHYNPNKIWPQYKSFDQYESEQLEELNNDLKEIEDDNLKNNIRKERVKSISDEYNELNNSRQLKNGPSELQYYFKIDTIEFNSTTLTIDLETEYDIIVDKSKDDGNNFEYVYAKIKTETQNNNNITLTKLPQSFPSGGQAALILSYFKDVLPVILKEVIPIYVKIIINNKTVFNLVEKNVIPFIENQYEMYGDLPDAIRNRYYIDDTFVLNGQAHINTGNLNLTLKAKTPKIKAQIGNRLDNELNESSIFLTILNYTALPINFLKDYEVILTNLIIELMNPSTVLTASTKYKQLKHIQYSRREIISMMGGRNDDILTLPMFRELPADINKFQKRDAEEQFKTTTLYFINSFNTILNNITNSKKATIFDVD